MTFKTPKSCDMITVAVPNAEFDVRQANGALMRVSPEELTTAFVLAVARDIKRWEPKTVLEEWKRAMPSVPCKFAILHTSMDRYWYALRLQADSTHIFQPCRRICYQRITRSCV